MVCLSVKKSKRKTKISQSFVKIPLLRYNGCEISYPFFIVPL